MAVNDAWLGAAATRRGARAFYAETRPIGRAFGVPDAMLPADLDAFEVVLGRDAGTRRPGPGRDRSPASWRASSCGRRSPAPSARLPLPTALYDWTLWPSVGLLPPAVREAYGLPWDARHRLVSEWLVAGLAGLAPAPARGLPPDAAGARRGPPARRATRRRALVDELPDVAAQHEECRSEDDPT